MIPPRKAALKASKLITSRCATFNDSLAATEILVSSMAFAHMTNQFGKQAGERFMVRLRQKPIMATYLSEFVEEEQRRIRTEPIMEQNGDRKRKGSL